MWSHATRVKRPSPTPRSGSFMGESELPSSLDRSNGNLREYMSVSDPLASLSSGTVDVVAFLNASFPTLASLATLDPLAMAVRRRILQVGMRGNGRQSGWKRRSRIRSKI